VAIGENEVKKIAARWLLERKVKDYGSQEDHLRLGWWVYTTTKGNIVYVERVDGNKN